MTGPPNRISQRYNTHAKELTERYLSLKIEDVFGDALEWLEVSACRVLDVGAGPGRDALWLSQRGHTVVAVGPVEAGFGAGHWAIRSNPSQWCLAPCPPRRPYDRFASSFGASERQRPDHPLTPPWWNARSGLRVHHG